MSSLPPPRDPERIGSILVVDDDPDLAALLVSGLGPYAHRVLAAEDLPRARLLLMPDVDVLVTDYALGSEDGLALVQHARATPTLHHVAIVLVSGHPDGARLELAATALLAAFVAKPFEIRVLLAAIRRAAVLVPPTGGGAA